MSGLIVEIQCSPGAPRLNCELIRAMLDGAVGLERECVPGAELGIWVCSDAEITDLHLRFMGIAEPTDVMSFPGEGGYLGDIAVSYQTAARQAAEIGHETPREIAYLILHGFLHLLGYDDRQADDRRRMLARQDAIFAEWEASTRRLGLPQD